MRLLTLLRGNLRRGLHLFVTRTKHLRESGDLARNPPLVGRLFKILLGSHAANHAFTVETLFQSTNGPVNGFAFT